MMLKTVFISLCLILACSTTQAEQLDEIIYSDLRKTDNKRRDVYRHPKETIEFFGIKPTDTLLEVWPGNGWYTEILAPYLKDKGHLITANFYTDLLNNKDRKLAYRSKAAIEFTEEFSDKSKYGDIEFVQYDPARSTQLKVSKKADAAMLIRMLHIWDEDGVLNQGLKNVYDSLKSGGTLAIIQHRSARLSDISSKAVEGYMSEDYVKQAVINAGFKFIEASDINANPKDTKDHPKGVYALPPTLAMGKHDQDKYIKIGESDRMTLKFIKE